MAHWTLDDVPWHEFDAGKVDPEMIRIAKAASLVEYNAGDYVRYLCNVFGDDEDFRILAQRWGAEEIQHGAALARWAKLADPDFDFDLALDRFVTGFRLETEVSQSIRGSRTGELIARCIVETGTSSFYTALADAAEEPVFRHICKKIAADEHRHYKHFYEASQRYGQAERLKFWRRLGVAASRIAESEDDELAYAYYAANGGGAPYDRRNWSRRYAARAYAVYRRRHVERGMAMIFKAVGLAPQGRLNRVATDLAWGFMRLRVWALQRYRTPEPASV